MWLSVSSVAETLGLSEDTIRRNIAKPASDPLLLPAFRALENATRIHFRDLEAFIRRNYLGTEVIFKEQELNKGAGA